MTQPGGDRPAPVRDPDPAAWPVLVTGAGGFVGGHVARLLARAGHSVRGLTRRPPAVEPGDPPIRWIAGDLRDPAARRRALEGVRGVIHAASWVSLGPDPRGLSYAINVEATRDLIADARAAGVERLVYTSTLYTLAAGRPEAPADEETPWNLARIDSPYTRTKRAAERLVLESGGGDLEAVVLCPGMVIGPRDLKPTSTRLLLTFARSPVALLPGGGIPIIDANVLALAHCRALEVGEPGRRYAVIGPYLSYHALAALVAQVAGRPIWVVNLPDSLEGVLSRGAGWFEDVWPAYSRTTIAGGFLRLHIQGDRADRVFGLRHPPPLDSIYAALEDAVRSGRAPGLRLRPHIALAPLPDESAPAAGRRTPPI